MDTAHLSVTTSITIISHQQKLHGCQNYHLPFQLQLIVKSPSKITSTISRSKKKARHHGHYKVILELIKEEKYEIIDTILAIINISIITSTPLRRWTKATQIMIDKGKGINVENLRIIQLLEADLNFILNIIWGYRMIRNSLSDSSIVRCQFSLPEAPCHGAAWNKLTFLDLVRKSLLPSIMIHYDAAAAFDRVLLVVAFLTCRRLGIPDNAGLLLHHLLQQVNFNLDGVSTYYTVSHSRS